MEGKPDKMDQFRMVCLSAQDIPYVLHFILLVSSMLPLKQDYRHIKVTQEDRAGHNKHRKIESGTTKEDRAGHKGRQDRVQGKTVQGITKEDRAGHKGRQYRA